MVVENNYLGIVNMLHSCRAVHGQLFGQEIIIRHFGWYK